MRRASLMVALAAAVIALSAGTLNIRGDSAEAAPPGVLVVGNITLDDSSGDCIATVNWSGLHGGKPMFIQTRLLDSLNNPVLFTTLQHKVKQGAGQLIVDYGSVTGVASISVMFSDNHGNVLEIGTGTGVCN